MQKNVPGKNLSLRFKPQRRDILPDDSDRGEMLLGENAKLFLKSAKGTDIIRPEDIKQKPLFYSKENEA